MNKRRILLMTTAILMVVAVSSIAISSVAAQSATRTLPAASVAPGGTFEVGIVATDYGVAGQVVETLPAGFAYVNSSLSPSAVTPDGQTVKFSILAGEGSFTYTVTASSTPGTHTFNGTFKDFDKNEYVVGGDTAIVVEGVVPTATRTLSAASVAPGENFNVGIVATDYGVAGQVVETLPAGFSYVSSSLSPTAVTPDGQTVKFSILAGEGSFTYTVTASSTEGTYTFSGILKDFDKNEYVVGGDTGIVVAADTTAPVITIVRPLDGSTTTDTTPTITATYSDPDSGINTTSVVLILDGTDVTAAATVTAAGVTFTPPIVLSYATHTVNLGVVNGAGLTATETWSFTVAQPTPTPTPTPTPRPSRGGGGGVPPVPSDATLVSTTSECSVQSTVIASSVDTKAAATINVGTIAKDAAGNALKTVTVAPPSTLPATPPSGVGYVGYAYNFGPAGATFNPAIEISIEFDSTQFAKKPVIYTYEAGAWKALVTTVVGNKATAMVDHFTTFVLFDAEVVPTPTPTPPGVAPTPTIPAVEGTPTPAPTPTPEEPGFEAVFAIAGLLAVAYLVLRRKRK